MQETMVQNCLNINFLIFSRIWIKIWDVLFRITLEKWFGLFYSVFSFYTISKRWGFQRLAFLLQAGILTPKISGPFWWILGLKYVSIDMWGNDQNEMMFFYSQP
jgi:hypothetical protein